MKWLLLNPQKTDGLVSDERFFRERMEESQLSWL